MTDNDTPNDRMTLSTVSFSGVSLDDGKAGGSIEQEGREKGMANQEVSSIQCTSPFGCFGGFPG